MDPFDAAGAMRHFRFEAQATASAFIGTVFAVAGGDGAVRLCAVDGSFRKVALHDGAILAMAANAKGDALYTAGDDGSLKRLGADGALSSVHEGRKWVDSVACNSRGYVAWSCGKTIYISKEGGEAAQIAAPSSVSGLAFSPDGKWLGAAVYGGALLISPSNPEKTKMLEWQGSHLTIGFSTDGRFCVTSMLENALHVWKIDNPEGKHGRMGGYPNKPLSFDWTADGRGMLTAGADVLVMWPFTGSDGPIGQQAQVFEGGIGMVRSVRARPRTRQVVIGYGEGGVALFDRADNSFGYIADANGSPVIDVRFSADGRLAGFIREDGSAGLLDMGKL
ncbi:MAG: WD40 repeat domain-containing protein [Ahrensia sp.]|nr:WD40 repeat domain-containing protein [Ahrensia sp.]